LNPTLTSALERVLTPLVRILLRRGVPFRAFADVAKGVYVKVATTELGIPGRKPSDSRIAVITGLSRKEVKRVKDQQGEAEIDTIERFNRAARVIGGWVRDPTYQDSAGEPAVLPLDGDAPSFGALVERYSGDVPARAVLDELLRVGAAERDETDLIRLRTRAYVPRADQDEKLGILGTDVGYLIDTIDHNLECDPGHAYFQRKVIYNNLPAETIPEFRLLAARHSQGLLELFDRWLAERDRDANPAAEGTGRKCAGVGIYFFKEDLDEPSEPN